MAAVRRKPCRRCGGPKGPGKRKHYCDECREMAIRENRSAAKRRDWEKHGDTRRASKRRHYAANVDRLREVNRANYRGNPGLWAKHRTAWAEANPERTRELKREREARRRARKKGVRAARIDALVVLEMHDGLCGICGLDVDVMNFHIDHIWPLALGGEHTYDNVQPAHSDCNVRKGWST